MIPGGSGEGKGEGAVDPVAARESYWEGFVRRMARVERIREEHRVLMLVRPEPGKRSSGPRSSAVASG